MPMMRIAGFFDAIIALLTGYLGLQLMSSSSGGTFFWWPLTTFGGSTLLLVGGLGALFPVISRAWLVALAGMIVAGVWVVLVHEFSWTIICFRALLRQTRRCCCRC